MIDFDENEYLKPMYIITILAYVIKFYDWFWWKWVPKTHVYNYNSSISN
jgi:hypothetical protein